jgi:hypothetical protein
MSNIEGIKVDGHFYIVGHQYGKEKKRTIASIGYGSNPLNLINLIGYDENNSKIFEVFSTNVVIYFKEK